MMSLFKPLVLVLLFFSTLHAGELRLERMETTLLQKRDKRPVAVELSVVLQGRDVGEASRLQLMDVVQTVLGGFWAETLVTATGKEAFKKRVIAQADSRYGLEVDFVYILNVRIETDTLERCLELIKEMEPNTARR
ncbi:hypothetical protein [Hydrogenimonas sp.]